MFIKVVTILAAVALASAQHQEAARFPAGVDPSSCPSYPNCDNAALHNQQPHNQWNPQPAANQWNQWNPTPAPSWNQQPAQQQWNQWDHQPAQQQWNNAPAAPQWNAAPAPSTGGDKYPAGVNPQSCPNYPYCDNAAGHSAPQVAPLPGWTERLYPAGVSAQSCPNFPYCH